MSRDADPVPAMPDTDSTPARRRRSPRRRGWLFVRNVVIELAVFVILYVLSIGPMFWHWYAGQHTGGSYAIVAFYQPLRIACRIEPIRNFVNWYIDLWLL